MNKLRLALTYFRSFYMQISPETLENYVQIRFSQNQVTYKL